MSLIIFHRALVLELVPTYSRCLNTHPSKSDYTYLSYPGTYVSLCAGLLRANSAPTTQVGRWSWICRVKQSRQGQSYPCLARASKLRFNFSIFKVPVRQQVKLHNYCVRVYCSNSRVGTLRAKIYSKNSHFYILIFCYIEMMTSEIKQTDTFSIFISATSKIKDIDNQYEWKQVQ